MRVLSRAILATKTRRNLAKDDKNLQKILKNFLKIPIIKE